jgi:hypothetical protein
MGNVANEGQFTDAKWLAETRSGTIRANLSMTIRDSTT